MQILIAAAFICIVLFLFLLFNVRIKDIAAELYKKQGAGSYLKAGKRKKGRIAALALHVQTMLEAMEQKGKFYTILSASVLLIVLGVGVGLATGNVFLVPVCAFIFAALPFLYLRFLFVRYNRMLTEEMETALNCISLSYERTENIMGAVEENLDSIHAPIKKIFESFLDTLKYSSPNMEAAIDTMKGKINHSVWKEWCDAFKRCSRDRNLKFILRPIVSKLSKIKLVTSDLKNILCSATKTFWTLLILNIVLLYVGVYLVPSGLQATIPIDLANLLVAINVGVIVVAGIKVSIDTKDIKFDI